MADNKHVIILGAGASYDLISSDLIADKNAWDRYRPPLAKEVLAPSRFAEIISQFSGVEDLTSSVSSALRSGKDLETYILELKNKGNHRLTQLIEFQFYIQKLFSTISTKIGRLPGNNYSDLINRIRDNGGHACILTFNYDTLLELNLPDYSPYTSLNDYVNHDIQVIKVHGSSNWSYVIGPYTDYSNEMIEEKGGIRAFLANNPAQVFGYGNKPKPEIRIEENYYLQDRNYHYYSYPALAVPMHNKHEHVCPPEHINEFIKNVQTTKKVLIIGWKAGDESVLELLGNNIKFPIEFTIVSGGQIEAEKVRDVLSKKLPFCNYIVTKYGFTDFMSSEECGVFFQ